MELIKTWFITNSFNSAEDQNMELPSAAVYTATRKHLSLFVLSCFISPEAWLLILFTRICPKYFWFFFRIKIQYQQIRLWKHWELLNIRLKPFYFFISNYLKHSQEHLHNNISKKQFRRGRVTALINKSSYNLHQNPIHGLHFYVANFKNMEVMIKSWWSL